MLLTCIILHVTITLSEFNTQQERTMKTTISKDEQIEILRVIQRNIDVAMQEMDLFTEQYHFDTDILQSILDLRGALEDGLYDACCDSYETQDERIAKENQAAEGMLDFFQYRKDCSLIPQDVATPNIIFQR